MQPERLELDGPPGSLSAPRHLQVIKRCLRVGAEREAVSAPVRSLRAATCSRNTPGIGTVRLPARDFGATNTRATGS
jgi:hypothetical protein